MDGVGLGPWGLSGRAVYGLWLGNCFGRCQRSSSIRRKLRSTNRIGIGTEQFWMDRLGEILLWCIRLIIVKWIHIYIHIYIYIYIYIIVLNFWFAHKFLKYIRCLIICQVNQLRCGTVICLWSANDRYIFPLSIPHPHVEVHLSSLSSAVGLDRTPSVLTPSCPSYVPGTCPCRYWMSWNECRCGTESLTEGRRKVWPRFCDRVCLGV